MSNTATLSVAWTSTTYQGTADNWSPITKSPPTTSVYGVVMFEFDSYGGSCCTTGTLAACAACDLAGTQKLFSYLSTNNKKLGHFPAPEKYTFTFANVYSMPTWLTSFRGRGGFTNKE